jgi:hypothetical protein
MDPCDTVRLFKGNSRNFSNWHTENPALYLVPLFFLLLSLTAEDEELCIIIICLLLLHLRVRTKWLTSSRSPGYCNPHLCERTEARGTMNSRCYKKLHNMAPQYATKRYVIKKQCKMRREGGGPGLTLEGPPIGELSLSAVRPPQVRRV